jgi:ribosomal protein S6--L-glutamate ligase
MATIWILTDERYLRQRMPMALVAELRDRSVAIRILVADGLLVETGPSENGLSPWAELDDGDVVVARTRNRLALALLHAAERPGIAVVPPWETIAAVRNKVRVAQILSACGVPTPRTFLADDPALLKRLPAADFPLILKPHLGDNGDGILVVGDPIELDDVGWCDELVLAQQFVDVGSVDLKLYVAGERLWAVRKPSPLSGGDGPVDRVEITPVLRSLAHRCRAAFGLELFGVDVLESPGGPLVVDVNEFPNYTGVAEAPAVIADLVLGHAGVGEAARERCAS